ncbi:MAG: LysR family transcriptional regulator [Betaproteobacteria bacterium]|nr:LysR family transcriptional regulator [Betaproteobacteria bacterium]
MTRARLRRYFRHGFFPQLTAFEACVRHGSVTRAAEELSLAQPTVSCLIRKLSETIGAPVLEARSRRMEPTAEGRELLVLCAELFGAFDRYDERRAGRASQAREAGTPSPLLSGAVALFTPTYAGVQLTLERPDLADLSPKV